MRDYAMCQSDEKAYLLASKLSGYQNRIKKAEQILSAEIQKAKRPALSFSAGKDSVVLLDLAVKAGFKGDLVFFKYGICTDVETPQENITLLQYYAEKHGLNYHILNCLGEADCWEMCGRFTLFPETKEEEKAFRVTNMDFQKQYGLFEKENETDLSIIGMRKKESERRRLLLLHRGEVYQTKSRKSITCCPIASLTNEDIWAYIFSNGLPYLPIYDYPYIDRRKNRNEITLLYNDAIIKNGMIFHYKQMYPDFFNWIKERWGNVI